MKGHAVLTVTELLQNTLTHTQLQSHLKSRVARSLRGFEQAVVWDRLNIELELYVSIYISEAGSASRAAKQSLNHIQFTRIISWIVFLSPPQPSSPSIPFKEPRPASGSPRGPPGPCVPFFGNFMRCRTKDSWHIHTFALCKCWAWNISGEGHYFDLCQARWRQQGGVGASSLEANKAAVIFSACGGGIDVRELQLYWMFAHQDES